jgi:hypothetical protein
MSLVLSIFRSLRMITWLSRIPGMNTPRVPCDFSKSVKSYRSSKTKIRVGTAESTVGTLVIDWITVRNSSSCCASSMDSAGSSVEAIRKFGVSTAIQLRS